MMAASQPPTSFTLSYPGGATQTTTLPIASGGVQQVTTIRPAQTILVDDPAVTEGSVAIAWYLDSVPDPLTLSAGSGTTLQARGTGSIASDYNPPGFVTFTVISAPPGAVYTAVDPWNTAVGCTGMEDGDTPIGSCAFTLQTPGTYIIGVSFVSDDANYPDKTDGLEETITVS